MLINNLVSNYFVLITHINYRMTHNHNLMKFKRLIVFINVFMFIRVEDYVEGPIKLKQITRYIYV